MFQISKLIPLIFFVALLVAWPVGAQSDVTDDDVNRVAKQLFCPTCENVPVDVCPTQTCADWRQLIRQQLRAGQSDEEILAYFAQQYGVAVLANPPRAGVGWFVWLVPIVVLVGGMVWFACYLNQLHQGEPANLPQEQEISIAPEDETSYRARLEAQLRE